jgi:hypothetical protein
MIWVITAMLWHHDITGPTYSQYKDEIFTSKVECLDHIFWNKGELVYKLVEVHGTREGKTLKTWAFYCEGTQLEEV